MKRNIFVWGVFDILHEGHLKLLRAASEYGDVFVITPPDERLKTWKKFVFNERTRRENLLKTGFVKEVFIDALPDIRCFDTTPPDIFCFGYDQSPEWKEKMIEHISGRFAACELMTMEEYAPTHSSELRKNILCPCGSGKIWVNCHGK